MKKLILNFLAYLTGRNSKIRNIDVFNTSRGAINGYDVVAYFTKEKAVKGLTKYAFYWKESMWQFSSEEHLIMFKTNPERYAPQFGGYCAYGTAQGVKAPTDPNAWAMVNEKLYLNYNKNAKKHWNNDRESCILKANANWPVVSRMEMVK
jgi:YHS domain-containing protein